MNRQLLGKLFMSITTVLLYKEPVTGAQQQITEYYLKPLAKEGIPESSVLLLPLLYNTSTKVLAKTAKAYLDKLITKIPNGIDKLIIADSDYFKFITKTTKVSDNYGSVIKGGHPGYCDFNCVYVPNYKSLFKQQ